MKMNMYMSVGNKIPVKKNQLLYVSTEPFLNGTMHSKQDLLKDTTWWP